MEHTLNAIKNNDIATTGRQQQCYCGDINPVRHQSGGTIITGPAAMLREFHSSQVRRCRYAPTTMIHHRP